MKIKNLKRRKLGTLENMYVQYVILRAVFEICSGNEVTVYCKKSK